MRSKKSFVAGWIVTLIAIAGGVETKCVAAPPAHRVERTQTLQTHLELDKRVETIILEPQRSMTLSVWRRSVCVWRGVPRRLRPWKIAAADVDGDGQQEIIVGVYKSTRFYPFLHNCLFVYGWNGKTGFPKWLGSSLSKPFTNFLFAHPAGRKAAELVSVETLPGGRQCVVAYSWNGFGFTGDWQRGSWRDVRLVGSKRGRVILQADGRRIIVGNN